MPESLFFAVQGLDKNISINALGIFHAMNECIRRVSNVRSTSGKGCTMLRSTDEVPTTNESIISFS